MRLVIVDDNRSLIESLKVILSAEKNMQVDGSFYTAESALECLGHLAPDILLVDLGLPGMSGIEFIKKAKQEHPKLDMLVYTVYDDWQNVFAALKAGATGYVLKGTTIAELITAVRDLHAGGSPMSSKIARMVISEFHEEPSPDVSSALSGREQQILNGMDKGWTYKQIAERLSISPHTVRTHIKNIYEKLHAKNKMDAVRKGKMQ